jgi:hypothetical protein
VIADIQGKAVSKIKGDGVTNITLLRRVRLATALTVPLAIGGVLMTLIGMMRTFDMTADGDSVEPIQLAGDISISLIIGTISFPIAIVAFSDEDLGELSPSC